MAILQRGSRFNDGKLIASQEYVDDHSNKKDNPHSVTKSQVGLGSVQNYGIATKAEAESGSANNKYITPLRAKEAISKLETIGVSLVLSNQVIEYNLLGANPSPTTTQLQANVYGNSEADTDLFFQFFSRLGTATAWTSMGGASASKTANISAPSQMSQLPLRYKVEVRRGSASGAIIATDYVELVGKTSQAIAGTNVTISGNTISAVNTVYSNATTSSSGLMSNTDKSKLDGVATGANNYTHPTSHPASMITETSTKRFVTDAEKSTWNGKQNALTAGSNVSISGSTISATDTTYGVATTSSNGLMASEDKTKLDGVATGANKYTHPSSHPASMITETSTKRFVTDAEKSTWNSKQNALTAGSNVTISDDTISAVNTTYGVATASSNGLMASGDKSKLDGIAAGANNYSHPSSHPASMITESTSQRFVSDSEKSTWNGKASTSTATTSANGLMSSSDKSKLNGIATGAQVNRTIATQAQAEAGTDNSRDMTPLRTKQAIEKLAPTPPLASTSVNGLMASTDKSKLDGIAAGANKYSHPSTHPYSMITGTPTSLPANGGSATSASHLLGDDTRSVNSNPSVYMSSGSRWGGRAGWQTEFKNVSTLGATSVMSGTYCYLQTHTPWSDSSGGYPIQVIYGADSPAWRVGVSNTAWSAWTKFADGGNASTVNGKTVLSNVPANAKFTDTNTTYAVATTSANGLMASGDKSKLNGISAGATTDATANAHIAKKDNPHGVTKAQVGLGSVSNVLQASKTEFDSHVGDTTHVTTAEKSTWNGKQNALTAGSNITISGNTISAVNSTYGLATTSANGLMASGDKSKLDGIATGANNYTHPSSHPASIITQNATNRFVTDAQISSWNAKPSNLDTITNQRTGSQLKYWVGTQAQYDAIGTKDADTIYDITQ